MNIIGPNSRALELGFTARRMSLLRWSYRHSRLPEAIARYAAAARANRIEAATYAVTCWRQQRGSEATLDALIARLPDVLPATRIEVWAGSLSAEYTALRPFVLAAWELAESAPGNVGDEISTPRKDEGTSIFPGVAA